MSSTTENNGSMNDGPRSVSADPAVSGVDEPTHHGVHAADEPVDTVPAAERGAGEPIHESHAAAVPVRDERVGAAPVHDDHVDAVPVRDDRHAVVDERHTPVVEREVAPRESVIARERAEFATIKWGSAFFGWLTATGMAVILTAILSAAGAGVGLGSNGGNTNAASNALAKNAGAVSLIGAIALAVILFVAYYCGGYVAGRMARFAGARQGFAVWIWAIIIAIVAAIVTAIAGAQFNVLGNINSFPRIPIGEGNLTVLGIITAILVAIISLGGAVLGGVAGMHYHRKVDRVGLQEL